VSRRPERACRHCDEKVATRAHAGAPWLVQCSKCGHSVCPLHVTFRKVRGESTYYVICSPRCILRKNKPKDDDRTKTGVNEWDYFHDKEW
jgi:hypothetical protein